MFSGGVSRTAVFTDELILIGVASRQVIPGRPFRSIHELTWAAYTSRLYAVSRGPARLKPYVACPQNPIVSLLASFLPQAHDTQAFFCSI